jgi:hypothetical protein
LHVKGPSPVLTPVDFFLWIHLKEHAYVVPPRIIVDLVTRIQVTLTVVDANMLKCVRDYTVQHTAFCLEIDGGRVEEPL